MSKQGPSPVSPIFNDSARIELARLKPEQRMSAIDISQRVHTVAVKCEAHFMRHRPVWVAREQGKLIQRQGHAPELRPPGRAPKDIGAQAARNVDLRQALRQANIALVGRRMIHRLGRDDGRGR